MVAGRLDEKKEIVIVAPFLLSLCGKTRWLELPSSCVTRNCASLTAYASKALSQEGVGSKYLKVRKREWQGDPRVKNAF